MAKRYTPREMLDRLVAFPTDPGQSNLDLVNWVANYLGSHGVDAGLDFNEDRSKASLFASIGPEVADGIVLSGHTDVVSIEGQDWSTNPWTVVEKEGRLHGRGTCDMKGFDAAVLSCVPDMISADLKRPIQLALTRDEEIGCLGAPPLIECMLNDLPRASMVIVGEPTMMNVVTGHKGGSGLLVRVRGHEVHSSILHRGVSAIMNAAKLIEWANQRNLENSRAIPSSLARVFEPPWTTLHVGTIWGGTAQNITARDCRFGLEYRCVPGDSADRWERSFRGFASELEASMKAVHPDAAIEISPFYDVPPLTPEEEGSAERLARSLTGDNGNHVVSYGTEAGQFQQRGYSAVVCGPGNIEQAHQPNEFLAVEQLDACERFIRQLITRMCN